MAAPVSDPGTLSAITNLLWTSADTLSLAPPLLFSLPLIAIRELPTDPEPSRLDFKIIAVVVVCSILGIVLLLLVLVLFVWKITRQRHEKDTYPLSEKSFSR